MSEAGSPLGFRLVGPYQGTRRLIDWRKAFLAHCQNEAAARTDTEAYLSHFTFAEELRQHLEAVGSPKRFTGAVCAEWLIFDLDVPNDLERARREACRLVEALARSLDVDPDSLLIWFSGAKGLHVGVPCSLWSASPSTEFHSVAKSFSVQLAAEASVAIDAGIYDRVRCVRAPNSRHPKTGLHKRRFTLDELERLSLDAVRSLSAEPMAFEPPQEPSPTPASLERWERATSEAVSHLAVRVSMASGPKRLNVATRLIIGGEVVPEGDRHRRLFSAAANLAEFQCPPALAQALLLEPGLDCGLTASEVERQIETGLAHGLREGRSTVSEASPPIAPNPATGRAKENAESLDRLWSEANGRRTVAAETTQPDVEFTLNPPSGAMLFFNDAKGRVCPPSEAKTWTWSGRREKPGWLPIDSFPPERLRTLRATEDGGWRDGT